jgi:hypothetical protein
VDWEELRGDIKGEEFLLKTGQGVNTETREICSDVEGDPG